MMDMTVSQLNLIVSGLEDEVKFLKKRDKTRSDELYDLRKKVEMLMAQFDLQGSRVMQPRLYNDPMKKPSDVLIHAVNLHDFEDKFDETMWKMFEIIATTGKARYTDIARALYEQDPSFADSRLRRAAKALTEMNVITKTTPKLPLTPNAAFYSIAEIGDQLYRKRFKACPVPSEMVKVIKEHDNLEHGYGILDLAQLLANSKQFKTVYAFNRDRPVKFNNGTQYIPDVTCVNLDGKTKTYFEYERGNHPQKSFNEKCDKMRVATRVLNFVAPNRQELVKKLYPLVQEWVKARGQSEYHDYLIRLTTPIELRKCYLSEHSWLVVFDPSKSVEPTSKINLDFFS